MIDPTLNDDFSCFRVIIGGYVSEQKIYIIAGNLDAAVDIAKTYMGSDARILSIAEVHRNSIIVIRRDGQAEE